MWLEHFSQVEDNTHLNIFYGISAINAMLALILLVVGCVLNNSKTPGHSLNFYIAIGSLMTLGSVIISGMRFDDNMSDDSLMNYTCKYYPALLCFGLMFWIGGILLRVICMLSFLRKSKVDKLIMPHREEWKPNAWMLLFILSNAAGILSWFFLYPLKVDKNYKCVDEDGSDISKWWKMGYSIVFAAMILLAFILVWPAVSMGSKRGNYSVEIDILTVSINNIILCCIAGSLVYFLFELDQFLIYIIIGGLFNWAAFLNLLLLLISNIMTAGNKDKEPNEDEDSTYTYIASHANDDYLEYTKSNGGLRTIYEE